MSAIDGIGNRLADAVATISSEPVDNGVVSDGGGRQPSGTGAPPVGQMAFERFVPPLPQPEVDPASVDTLQAMLDSDQLDLSSLMIVVQELQQKVDRERTKSMVDELEANKVATQKTVDQDLKKIDEAAKKLEKAKKWNIFTKIFRALVVAFTTLAAIATAGALTIAVAAIGAAVTVLEETGAMKKMFDAMGVSEDAQQWIMVGISAFLAVAGLGAAGMALKAASGAANAAGAAGAAATIWNVVVRQAAAAAQVVGGIAQVGEGATQVGAAVNQYQIAEIEYDRKKIEIENLKLKKQQDDLTIAFQELMQKIEDGVRAVLQIVKDQAELTASIAKNTRALRT
jgi:hypothetical protein